ncbi:MAG: hypothetical protein ACK559_35495, partial [bacterium]
AGQIGQALRDCESTWSVDPGRWICRLGRRGASLGDHLLRLRTRQGLRFGIFHGPLFQIFFRQERSSA